MLIISTHFRLVEHILETESAPATFSATGSTAVQCVVRSSLLLLAALVALAVTSNARELMQTSSTGAPRPVEVSECN